MHPTGSSPCQRRRGLFLRQSPPPHPSPQGGGCRAAPGRSAGAPLPLWEGMGEGAWPDQVRVRRRRRRRGARGLASDGVSKHAPYGIKPLPATAGAFLAPEPPPHPSPQGGGCRVAPGRRAGAPLPLWEGMGEGAGRIMFEIDGCCAIVTGVLRPTTTFGNLSLALAPPFRYTTPSTVPGRLGNVVHH